MYNISSEVHLLAVLIFLAVSFSFVLFADWCQDRGGRRAKVTRILLWVMLAGYLVIYTWLAFFIRPAAEEKRLELRLFWSYREAFGPGLQVDRLGLARQILLNWLVYVPLGYLLIALLRRIRHPLLWAVLGGFGLSLLTEVTQYVFHRGLCELDDLLDNTLGCLIGAAAMLLARRLTRAWRRKRGNGGDGIA